MIKTFIVLIGKFNLHMFIVQQNNITFKDQKMLNISTFQTFISFYQHDPHNLLN